LGRSEGINGVIMRQLATLGQFARHFFIFNLFSYLTYKSCDFLIVTNKQVTNKQKGHEFCKYETTIFCTTSGFRLEADENCVPLGYYAARIGYSVSTFRDILSVPFLRVKNPRGLEDGTDTLSRNVGKELPLLAS
jgi:hypothetical protein